MAKKISKKKKLPIKNPSSLKLRRARKAVKRVSKKKIGKKSAMKKVVKKIVKKVKSVSQKATALPEISKETFDYFMAKLEAI